MSHPNPSPLSTFTTILNKVLAVGLAGGTALIVFTFATSGLRSLSAGDKKAAEPKTEAAASAAAASAQAALAPVAAVPAWAGSAPEPGPRGSSRQECGTSRTSSLHTHLRYRTTFDCIKLVQL